jgi:hypothetical protein
LPVPSILRPIKANIFINYQPRAPAPITNELEFVAFFIN